MRVLPTKRCRNWKRSGPYRPRVSSTQTTQAPGTREPRTHGEAVAERMMQQRATRLGRESRSHHRMTLPRLAAGISGREQTESSWPCRSGRFFSPREHGLIATGVHELPQSCNPQEESLSLLGPRPSTSSSNQAAGAAPCYRWINVSSSECARLPV